VSESDVILSIRGVTRSYGDVVAVRDLSLDILRGEVFGLLGPNGAGKTTTISIVCGLLHSDSGDVVIDGKSTSNHRGSWHRLLGLCPQELVIWESLTCLEQLQFVGQLYDISRSEAKSAGMAVLETLGLGDHRDRLARTLSGGMKRRLNIALALVHDPEIVILDEPQAGLDPQSRILVREHIRSLAQRKTVILTTHDMDEADRLADRIAVVDHGRLLELDTAEGLKGRIGEGEVLEVRPAPGQADRLAATAAALPQELNRLSERSGLLRLVGRDVGARLPEIMSALRQAGVEIEDVTLRKKTLEDVFIALTGRGLRE